MISFCDTTSGSFMDVILKADSDIVCCLESSGPYGVSRDLLTELSSFIASVLILFGAGKFAPIDWFDSLFCLVMIGGSGTIKAFS